MLITIVLFKGERRNEEGSRNIIYIKTKKTSKSNHRDHIIRKRINKVKNYRFETKSPSHEKFG